MPSAGSYFLYNPASLTFAGIADDNTTVVGYTTLDKAQVVRHRLYFPAHSELTACSSQWELGSDNHIGTVLRNGQTKYMAANTDVNVTDITVGCVWTYECISANMWR